MFLQLHLQSRIILSSCLTFQKPSYTLWKEVKQTKKKGFEQRPSPPLGPGRVPQLLPTAPIDFSELEPARGERAARAALNQVLQ